MDPKPTFVVNVCNQTVKTRKEMCKLIMDPKANFCCKCVQPTHTDMDVCFRPAKTTKRKHKPKAWWLSHDPTTLQKPLTPPSTTLPPPRHLLLHERKGIPSWIQKPTELPWQTKQADFFDKN